MKRVLTTVGLFAFLAVLPTVHAADATGTWKGKFDLHGTSMPLTFHLTVAAGAVTGTVEGLPTTPVEIHDGKVNGDTLTFWLSSDYQGQSYKLVYTGKLSPAGDEIAFTFGTEDQGWSAQMTTERSAETASTPCPHPPLLRPPCQRLPLWTCPGRWRDCQRRRRRSTTARWTAIRWRSG